MEKKDEVILVETDTPGNMMHGLRSTSHKATALMTLALASSSPVLEPMEQLPSLGSYRSSVKGSSNSAHSYTPQKLYQRKLTRIRKIAKRSRQLNRRKLRGMRISTRRI